MVGGVGWTFRVEAALCNKLIVCRSPFPLLRDLITFIRKKKTGQNKTGGRAGGGQKETPPQTLQ